MKTSRQQTKSATSFHPRSAMLFVAVLGAALLSFVLLNRSALTDRGPSGHELAPQQQNDVLLSPFMIDNHVMSMIQELDQMQHRHEANFFNLRAPSIFTQPQFVIHEDDEAVTVKVDVPKDVPLEEIQVEIRAGSILHIQGGHDDKHSSVRFEKTFALGRHMNADNITAKLTKNAGELVITAPKVTKKEEDVRKIDVIKTEL